MEVRKRTRTANPPAPAEPTVEAPRKRARPVGAPKPTTTYDEGNLAKVQAPRAHRSIAPSGDWESLLGTKHDPIQSGDYKPGDMIACGVYLAGGGKGDARMGFVLPRGQKGHLVYGITLEGRLVYRGNYRGWVAAYEALKEGHYSIAMKRSNMKSPPVLF